MPVQGKQSAAAEVAAAEPAHPQTTPATDAAPAAAADSPPTKRVKVEPAAETTEQNGAEAKGGAGGGDVELRWEIRGGGRRGRPNSKGLKRQDLDPVIPVTDDSILGPVKEFYGLEAGFPLSTHLVTRCMDAAERPKRCYYVSDSVRRLLMMDESESLTVIQVGLKVRLPPAPLRADIGPPDVQLTQLSQPAHNGGRRMHAAAAVRRVVARRARQRADAVHCSDTCHWRAAHACCTPQWHAWQPCARAACCA